jgi:hypothetical protein
MIQTGVARIAQAAIRRRPSTAPTVLASDHSVTHHSNHMIAPVK